ncbi:unnamed protein product [Trichogramma brassicae]|uniref:Uncharacterized protein n=1 Tax=Trichogramma brassicae TaxID=86971 RepID=A0A6H5I4T8_9HYME|nr:unnamed protein product [Trichogramma brassicae]
MSQLFFKTLFASIRRRMIYMDLSKKNFLLCIYNKQTKNRNLKNVKMSVDPASFLFLRTRKCLNFFLKLCSPQSEGALILYEGSDQKPLLPDGQTLMPKTPAQRERRRVQQQRSRARKREEDQQRTRQIDPRPPLRITARKILDLPLPPWASQQHVALSMPSLEYDIEEARPSVRSVVVVPPTNHHLYYDPEHPEF